MDPMSRSLISRWFQPQKFDSMPGYTVEKRAADNMLKSSVPEPQYLAPKSNCELAPLSGRSSNHAADAPTRSSRDDHPLLASPRDLTFRLTDTCPGPEAI